MTTAVETRKRIRIAAPDARTAFALERRLAYFHPVAIGHGANWDVEFEDTEDRLDEITIAVEHWLREIGIRATEMQVDGDFVTLAVHAQDEP